MPNFAMVTGGAKRIGRHFSIELARAGYDVIIHHGHSEREAEETAREIHRMGKEAIVFHYDFSEPAALETNLARIPGDIPIAALINSAAIFEPLSFKETSLQEWNEHFSINLTAPFLLSKWFFNRLKPDQKGRIINILDWRALRPGADHFPYTISKSALAAMTKSLALSMAPRVSVNGIAFGAVLPPSDGSPAEKMLANVPMNRAASLDEVTQMLLFLLQGPEYITGEIIHLDGGRHLI